MAESRLPLALVAALVACTSSGPRSGGPDASVTAPLMRAPSIVKLLSTWSELAPHVGKGGRLERRDGGYALADSGRGFTSSMQIAMKATLPVSADAPLRIVDAARTGFSIELSAVDLRAVRGETFDGAIVYADAAADLDVVQVAERDRVEEVRVLRSPKARPEASWRVKTGPAVAALRARDGIVEALDDEGRVRLRTEPAFALDARGTRREVTLTIEEQGGARVIVARFDDQGLVHPIALDPAWIGGLSPLPSAGYQYQQWAPLPDGRVAAFPANANMPAALLDPVTEKWTQVGVNSGAKQYGIVVTLGTGKVLVAGGEGRSTAELWTPSTGPVATGSMSVARSTIHYSYAHIDKGLSTEKVIVYGGATGWGNPGSAYSTVEQYDVATGTWSVRPTAMPVVRCSASATDLGDGTVLIAGGRTGGGWTNTALLHDLATDTYTTLPVMPANRAEHQGIRLSSGNALLVGGTSYAYTETNAVFLYNRAAKTFSTAPSMKYSRYGYSVLPYGTGKWLMLGGRGKLIGGTTAEDYLSTSEIFDETGSGSWSDGPTMMSPRGWMGVAWLNDGRAVTGGGLMPSGYTADKVEFLVPDKVTCTTGSECVSGFCSEGYCCNRACTGQCEACDVGGREGTCLTISGEAPHGTKPSCGTYVQCGPGGTCATSCASDGACTATTAYCTTTNVCAPKKANGAGCTFANECTSGYCVDGVCCNSACTAQCEACNEAGKAGTCSPVDGPPRGTRPACVSPYACSAGVCATGCSKDSECASTSYCDVPTGTCKPKLGNGTACTAGSNCASGFCVDGVCCNSACTSTCQACNVVGKAGTCSNVPTGSPPSTGKSCGAFNTCNGAGACSTTCTSDTQCASTAYCLGGGCVTRKANGNSCGSNLECTSGFCSAGTCCNSACTGECESCSLGGSTGTCTPKPGGVLCGLSGCVGSYLVPKGKCAGTSNTCEPQPATECPGSLKCASATTCLTTCTTNADCVRGVCESGSCVVAFDAGPADTYVPDTYVPDTYVPDTYVPDTYVPDTYVPDTFVPDTFVPDTFVPDTFVEDTFVPDTAVADTWTVAETPAPKLDEKPVVPEFQRCTKSSECPSGFCVEGVCCDSACGERCHSCALLTSPGKCTQEPIGVDLKSECGPALSCLGTCGDKGQCVGSGTGTMCARNRCTGPSTGVGPAYCGGPGASCPTDDAVPFDCSPYICEPAFGACRTSCVTSNDCAQGFTCDIAAKTCTPLPPPPGPEEDSGCAVATPGVSRAGGAALLVLLGVGLLARRRR
ncbi:MAG: hypothetical protein HYV09_00050 [Deltaproteobacteria bacterium]|nr:hypothetical protein [Deltaproteobacteria bacterium]